MQYDVCNKIKMTYLSHQSKHIFWVRNAFVKISNSLRSFNITLRGQENPALKDLPLHTYVSLLMLTNINTIHNKLLNILMASALNNE